MANRWELPIQHHIIEVRVVSGTDENNAKLDLILGRLGTIQQTEARIMATAQDIIAEAAEQSTVVDSVVVLLDRLTEMVAEAVASGDPKALEAALAELQANKAELVDATVRNTPADTGA